MEQVIELTLIPFALLLVQAIKILMPRMSKYSIPVILLVGAVLAVLLVDWEQGWQMAAIAMISATVQIASGASGVYSWGKKSDMSIELPDFADDK